MCWQLLKFKNMSITKKDFWGLVDSNVEHYVSRSEREGVNLGSDETLRQRTNFALGIVYFFNPLIKEEGEFRDFLLKVEEECLTSPYLIPRTGGHERNG